MLSIRETASLTTRANTATLTEAAEICGCKRSTLESAVARGALMAERKPRDGGKGPRYVRLVNLKDVEIYLQGKAADSFAARCVQARRLRDQGRPVIGIAQDMGVTTRTVHRWLRGTWA